MPARRRTCSRSRRSCSTRISRASAAAKAEDAPKAKGKRMEGGLLIANACTKGDDDTVVAAAVVAPPAGGGPAEGAAPAKTAEAKQPATSEEPAKTEEKPAEEKPEKAEKSEEKPEEKPAEETASTEEAKPPSSGSSTVKTIGFISLATGGAGLIAGGCFGLLAVRQARDS